MKKLGEQLSPILTEIEETLLENYEQKPDFTLEGFRASLFIFQSALMDKMWEVQETDNLSVDERSKMAEDLGKELKNLVFKYAEINTFELYE